MIHNLPISVKGDPILMGSLDGYELAAPQSFWSCPELVGEVVGGCGPGGFGDYLVPDTVYFLSIRPACKIHDWMFAVYNCEEGFNLGNKVFLDNMNRINRLHGNNIIRYFRSKRIEKYHYAVCMFGRLFYYDAHLGLYESKEVYA